MKILDTKAKIASHYKATGERRKIGDTVKVRRVVKFNVFQGVTNMKKVGPIKSTVAKQKPTAAFRQVGGDHYMSKTVQPWDAMEAWMTREEFVGFLRGNVIKYMARDKNGIEDFKKAQHYIDKLIETLEK